MATMHPIDLENYDYTPSEKEMYLALQEQLSDRMQVFYSIRWFETDCNNKRFDSECDFLIFDPSFGFLTIEVKGGTGIEIEDGKWYLNEDYNGYSASRRELKCSPYEQAEKSMRHFYNYFVDEFNQVFYGVYGSAVAFPRYAIDNSLAQEAPLELTIDINDMSNLSKRINEIFHYWKNKRNITIPFSEEQRNRFINVINKRISLSAAAGALIPIKQKEFSKIDFVQDSVLDILFHYHQVQIVGGAGTGKTFIAIKKALRDIVSGKRVLFLCCNKELSNFVNTKVKGNDLFKCCTFEELMVGLIGAAYWESPLNENGSHCCFDLLDDNIIEHKYDSIIVDEAQDFDIDMGLSVRIFLKDDKHSNLYVFYDENQNVFSKNFENAFAINYPPFILRYNIRNTGCIYKYAVKRTSLGIETIANSLLGVTPEVTQYKNKNQTLKALTGIVNRLIKKEYVKTKSIVILSDENFDSSVLAGETCVGGYDISFADLDTIDDTQICFKTTEEFKGLEADIVIYLENEYENVPKDDVKICKEYVALTRARYYLYILSTKRTL
jgi:hypothetical protein